MLRPVREVVSAPSGPIHDQLCDVLGHRSSSSSSLFVSLPQGEAEGWRGVSGGQSQRPCGVDSESGRQE